ncbi:YcnI family protein [Arthrobacter cryoconiti]|uniref:YcnI family protein n=1 Tax=Arthrobacter cryoconiti TaxID=748907 RepID=A0ABV8R6X8_9MICC|nr:YcnI family protein [Arthrobacter cryoconiti]MCC9066880.1 YcnI family protein [Arthrobacter cryoconiti]
MKTSSRRTFKTVTTGVLAVAFLAAGAASASAHVKAVPDATTAGGYTHVTFNVPNESPTAKTSKITVTLPTDEPFTSVSVKPLDGWTATVITSELPKPVTVGGSTVTKAATSVEWIADAAHEIGANQYQTFSLSLGKLPASGTTVTLPTAQTYTDGTVANWDQKSVAGQEEPKHPAPSFVTTTKDEPASQTAAAAPSAASSTTAASSDVSALSVWGIALGAAGLLLGGIALGLVISARRKPENAK